MSARRYWLASDDPDANSYQRWQIIGGAMIAVAVVLKLIAFALVFRFHIDLGGPHRMVAMLLGAFGVAALGLAIGLTATYLDWRHRHRG